MRRAFRHGRSSRQARSAPAPSSCTSRRRTPRQHSLQRAWSTARRASRCAGASKICARLSLGDGTDEVSGDAVPPGGLVDHLVHRFGGQRSSGDGGWQHGRRRRNVPGDATLPRFRPLAVVEARQAAGDDVAACDEALEALGYRVIIVPLPAFLRSGGAAFCLTLRLDRQSAASAGEVAEAAVA